MLQICEKYIYDEYVKKSLGIEETGGGRPKSAFGGFRDASAFVW